MNTYTKGCICEVNQLTTFENCLLRDAVILKSRQSNFCPGGNNKKILKKKIQSSNLPKCKNPFIHFVEEHICHNLYEKVFS